VCTSESDMFFFSKILRVGFNHDVIAVYLVVNVTTARHLSSYARRDHVIPTSLYSKMIQLSRSLGHLSAVYCIAFDRTGDYIFTVCDKFNVDHFTNHL